MKETKFVRIKSKHSGFGMLKGMVYEFENVEETIRAHIAEGWTYCGFVPVETRGVGDVETMSLVFTKDSEE